MRLAASQATHQLVEALATSRAQIGDPQARSRRGTLLTEQGVKSLAVGYIRRKLGIVAIKAQCLSLLGRIDGLGPGVKIRKKCGLGRGRHIVSP